MSISIFDSPGIDALARECGIDPHQIRRLRLQLFKHARSHGEALAQLDEHAHEALNAAAGLVDFQSLTVDAQHHSHEDGATKVLFRTLERGLPVESVILRNAGGRTTVCISAQSGCALRCEFCATGYMGFQAQLSVPEILDQVMQCAQIVRVEGRRLRNVVFMGMGEPFDNEATVCEAVECLISRHQFGLDDRRVMVSTVGIPEAMGRFARRFPTCGLALSLHSVCPTVRERLIPVTRRYPLPEIRDAILETSQIMHRAPMIEYLMLAGVTDSIEDDIPALLQFLEGTDCHVNLIPFNPIEQATRLQPSNRTQIEAFAQELRTAGRKVTIRRSLGIDIAAACGQLAQQQSTDSHQVSGARTAVTSGGS